MKEIGGHFELEIRDGEGHYHPNALKLNTVEYLLKTKRCKKVYIPYYTCKIILEPLHKCNMAQAFYLINSQLEPIVQFSLGKNEDFLYTNYHNYILWSKQVLYTIVGTVKYIDAIINSEKNMLLKYHQVEKGIALIRFLLFSLFFKRRNWKNFRYKRCCFDDYKKISIGKNNKFSIGATISELSSRQNSIVIGNNNIMDKDSTLMAHGGYIIIGDNNYIGFRVQIQGKGGVVVGNKCMVNKSLDECGIYVGIPAKRIKERKRILLEIAGGKI